MTPSPKRKPTNVPRYSPVEIRPEPSPVRRYLLLIVLVVMAITSAYLLMNGFGSPPPQSQPIQRVPEQAKTAEETNSGSILDRVLRHVSVSASDAPSVWSISNLDLVKPQNPALFRDAEQGDYVVAWSDRVVIYSASKDRIVGMLMAVPRPSTASEGVTMASAEPKQETATVEIRNASGVTGAAKRLKSALTASGLTVDKVGDAAIRRTGTLIVDLTGGTAPQTIAALQGATSGTVATSVPDGEPATKSGILVLIGR